MYCIMIKSFFSSKQVSLNRALDEIEDFTSVLPFASARKLDVELGLLVNGYSRCFEHKYFNGRPYTYSYRDMVLLQAVRNAANCNNHQGPVHRPVQGRNYKRHYPPFRDCKNRRAQHRQRRPSGACKRSPCGFPSQVDPPNPTQTEWQHGDARGQHHLDALQHGQARQRHQDHDNPGRLQRRALL